MIANDRNEIDDLIIQDSIQGFRTPREAIIEITQVSQIPGLINRIRELKYGPKLILFGNEITTEFRAGFYGKSGTHNYLEQLYLMFKDSTYIGDKKTIKNNTHDGIMRLLIDVENEINNSEKVKNFRFAEKNKMKGFRYYFRFPEFQEELEFIMSGKSDANKLQHQYQSSYQRLESLVGSGPLNFLIPDAINDLLRAKELPDGRSIKLLQKGLVAVWLVAETFRYPPMLFYGLLILHLFDNGYIKAEEIKDLHFAFQAKSHSKLGNSCKIVGARTTDNHAYDEYEKLKEMNFKILKKFYHGICNEFKGCSPEKKKKFATPVFKFYLNYYLRLCGFNNSNMKFSSLIPPLEQSYRANHATF